MSKHYAAIAFTDGVQRIQRQHGSDTFYGNKRRSGEATPGTDALTAAEKEFLADRDGFYLSSVSETGWPYVQFRGGPKGFVHTLDDHTIAWADFRGNLQYVSTGNVAGDDRVAIIAVDYVRSARLKLFGHVRIVTADDDPDLVHTLTDPGYDAVVERAVLVTVEAYDWNCPQHIPHRYTVAELEPALRKHNDDLRALEAENAMLRAKLADCAEVIPGGSPT
ncbi:pyridoxamine 5'-phosphate oxidase family protein [Mycobacterium sp. 236(2023)]|uniref:pyridoxamine 5'-phosphate oxidase family protein n=1 Tax=Mycobacterium sp. 236(2023) TaxID=3038163 RepID=UPI0024155174|nr:pyridoxamine 5'-phosphate oxidase family protein [Mycobacterium sp. 236(2023)]MDG4667033.1 pyridoxamine 5'-phosphate oxidase family protein [Mycobacterium sp. 236(2023)]